jgi:hypothetical protein
MYRSIVRTLYLTWFTLIEYYRSGRILIDLLAGMVFFYVFLMVRSDRSTIDAEHFFTLTSIFTLVLSLYTMSATLSLGDRPQSYVLLSRKLGRSGYLLGLYFHAFLVVAGIYILLSVSSTFLGNVEHLTVATWMLGSIPLLLNVGLFMALLLMLSPMVFPTGWRLFVLGLFALAFSGNFFTGPVRNDMPQTLDTILSSLQTILSWPLVPAFSGFALAVSHTFDMYGLVVMVAQGSLLVALLGLAMFAFSRREIIFGVE